MAGDAASRPGQDPVIETERLTKSYGAARGIVEVDLRVEAGEVFGFLGPNGAGKTTLIRTLLDLIRPTSGRARVLGMDSRAGSVEIRRRTSYLPGDLALYERLTARQHLRWLAQLAGGIALDRARELAEELDLDLDRPIRALSKGNRQKVGLVQAFMADPELLVLDEPTAGLDPLVQRTFQRLAREMAAQGRTVFLSSHVLDEVQAICDRVGIIREGRMVAVEAVETLRARSVRLFTIHFAGTPDVEPIECTPGVQDLECTDHVVRLTLDGPADPLIKALADQEVLDLVSEQADLDDVFLAFYGGTEVGGAGGGG